MESMKMTFKREAGIFRAGHTSYVKTGTATSVFEGEDFFRFMDCINNEKSKGRMNPDVCLLHSHPPGVSGLSKTDVESLVGIRHGLARNFYAIIVLDENRTVSYRVIKNKRVEIVKMKSWANWLLRLAHRDDIKMVWHLSITENGIWQKK